MDFVTNAREFLHADEAGLKAYQYGGRQGGVYRVGFSRGRIDLATYRRSLREAEAADRDPLGMSEWDEDEWDE